MQHAGSRNSTGDGRVGSKELAKLLLLFANQIDAALADALEELDGLTQSVLETVSLASDLAGKDGSADSAGSAVRSDVLAVRDSALAASMRMQFADRFSQRISNVARHLGKLAAMADAIDISIDSAQWTAYLQRVRATYTTEQERKMFDDVLRISESAVGGQTSDESTGPILF